MKYLIITGASGNLGRELIGCFDFQNYNYVFLIGKEKELTSLDINQDKFRVISGLDLTQKSDIQKIFDQINETQNDELFIIHLVGEYEGGKFLWEYEETDLMKLIKTNFLSSFIISGCAIQKVKRMRGGSIIFMSSRITLEYEPKRSAYAISKQSLNFLVKIIEKEASQFNFTANAIAPAIILTEENKKWIDERNYQKFISPPQISNLINLIFSNYGKLNGNIFTLGDKI